MNFYKSLNKQIFQKDNYKLVPIRFEDRVDIMQWRNEQIYHLRQDKPLTINDQDLYFKNVVNTLFEKEKPNQILFSYLENDLCIGYGGLVHINWIDKNAEISFVMNTKLQEEKFQYHWKNYLKLIEEVAFIELDLHKIFTYAFDLRPKLYIALEESEYLKEAVLSEHCFFNNKFIDVVIHQKTNPLGVLNLRAINAADATLLYNWANEKEARNNALSTDEIPWEGHVNWFNEKLIDNENNKIFILYLDKVAVGQIRIEKLENSIYWRISYSIDKNYRGKGLGQKLVSMLVKAYPNYQYKAEVKVSNIASKKIFEKLNFRVEKISEELLIFYNK